MKTKKAFLVSLLTCLALVFTVFGVGNMTAAKRVDALTEDEILGYFTAVGDVDTKTGVEYVEYVKSISYGTFTNTNFSGEGVIVETRNKTAELVDHTEKDNSTNPMLIDFPSVKYSTGVKFDGVVDISDNTASDTLIELAFPGTNDNYQNRGFKVIIEDASDPNNYIALFVWSAYSNTDATGGSVIAAAAGTWEKTNFTSGDVYIGEAGFDTNNYNGNAIFSRVGDDLHDGAVGGDGKPKDGCYLNTKEYGHEKTSVNFSRTSENSIKVQFDNANGSLSINGVHIRDFKNFSADDTHYFPGFTNDEVKLSVGIMRTTRRSTDEFTKFCIMDIDEHDAKIPASGLIASGTTDIPAPVSYSFFKGETAIDTFAVNITDPEGNTTANYSDATFTFDRIGTYEIEYLVNSASVGSASFAVAAKNAQNELAEVTSFEVSDNLFTGKKISLADFTLTAGEEIAIESATVEIYKGEELIATETADADWTYTLATKGELTFKVSNDNFSLVTSATVLPGLYPSAAIENGSVVINGAGEAVGLFVGTNDFVITPDKGYALASLTIGGEDVTAEVIDGVYTYNVENAENDVTYSVVFEQLPTVTVTFTVDGETVGTVSDVLNGTLFGEIEAPEIPAKENYNIVGWNIGDDVAITDNVTAEAVYAIKTYTITFDTDGGTQIAAKTYTALETVEEPEEVPAKEGYVFDAWYLGTEKYVFGGMLTADITLTAKYNVKKLKVTVKSADFDDVVLTIDYNTAISTDKLGEKSGYEFKGLFTDEGLTKAYNGEKITADTTLYASYAKTSGCGGNILGSGFEFASLVTLIAAVCIVCMKNRKAKQN